MNQNKAFKLLEDLVIAVNKYPFDKFSKGRYFESKEYDKLIRALYEADLFIRRQKEPRCKYMVIK